MWRFFQAACISPSLCLAAWHRSVRRSRIKDSFDLLLLCKMTSIRGFGYWRGRSLSRLPLLIIADYLSFIDNKKRKTNLLSVPSFYAIMLSSRRLRRPWRGDRLVTDLISQRRDNQKPSHRKCVNEKRRKKCQICKTTKHDSARILNRVAPYNGLHFVTACNCILALMWATGSYEVSMNTVNHITPPRYARYKIVHS